MEENRIFISYLEGLRVDTIGNQPTQYLVSFLDGSKQIIYQSVILNNMWASCIKKYYDNYIVEIINKTTGEILVRESINLKDKKVKIIIESSDINEVLSIIDLVDKFQKYHECILHCIVYDEDLRKVLDKTYKDIIFYSKDTDIKNYYASYKIGRFKDYVECGWTRLDHVNSDFRKIALDVLGFDIPHEIEEPITIITAHPSKSKIVELLKSTLKTIKTKIILSVNHSVDEEVQKLCDYVVYDKQNPILKQSEFNGYGVRFYYIKPDGTESDFEFEHSYAVYRLISNGLELAKSLGYKKVHYYNYDCQFSEESLKEQLQFLNTHDCVVYCNEVYNHGIKSFDPACWGANIDKVLPFFRKYKTKGSYYVGGAGPAPCAFLDIKIAHGFKMLKLNVKELNLNELMQKNKINMVMNIQTLID